jgi:hypothetical protein
MSVALRARQSQRALVMASLLALIGCSNPVRVEEDFPVPLVEQLPLRVALHYGPELRDYTLKDSPAGDRDWIVQLGTANLRMFDSAFTGLFHETRRVSSVAAAAQEMPELDVIISPSVDAFELSLPGQATTDRYAAWVRYHVDVHARDGQLLVRWTVPGYGQCGTEGLSDEESLERAAVLALRDAAAAIAVGFARQPKIREALLGEEQTPP